jgi:hypothetical protein
MSTWTKVKGQVIDASKSYKSTIKDYIMEELESSPSLEIVPNNVLSILLEPHRVNIISFIKEFSQHFTQPGLVNVKVDGTPMRFRAFKNHEYWKAETDTEKYRQQYAMAVKLINLSSKKF